MKSFEFTGKNVEKAIEAGLKELNKRPEEVDIKILSDGGLFKKAKVQISFEEKEEVCVCEECKPLEVKEEVKEVAKENLVEETKEEIVEVKEELTKQENNQVQEYLKEYLTGLLETLNIKSEVEIKENEENITATINSEDSSRLIGYRGECLNAIQYITNLSVQNKFRNCKRIYVDIANYREKREQALKNLAERIAKKVERTGRPQKLEPMTPNERRIIHTHLQQNKNVETESTGTEPRRYLTVYPRGYEKK